MTKEQVIAYSRSKNAINSVSFLRDYCIERGKDPQITEIFLRVLMQTGMLDSYADAALEILMTELDIVTIRDRERQVILIY